MIPGLEFPSRLYETTVASKGTLDISALTSPLLPILVLIIFAAAKRVSNHVDYMPIKGNFTDSIGEIPLLHN